MTRNNKRAKDYKFHYFRTVTIDFFSFNGLSSMKSWDKFSFKNRKHSSNSVDLKFSL